MSWDDYQARAGAARAGDWPVSRDKPPSRSKIETERRARRLANALLWDVLVSLAQVQRGTKGRGKWAKPCNLPLAVLDSRAYAVDGNPYAGPCTLWFLCTTDTAIDRGNVQKHEDDLTIWADGVLRRRWRPDFESHLQRDDIRLMMRPEAVITDSITQLA